MPSGAGYSRRIGDLIRFAAEVSADARIPYQDPSPWDISVAEFMRQRRSDQEKKLISIVYHNIKYRYRPPHSGKFELGKHGKLF